MAISNPKLYTKELHDSVLNELRNALEDYKLQEQKPEWSSLRVRNWLFFLEDGKPTLDIILDKGYKSEDLERQIVPRQADSSVNFDDCAALHHFFMSHQCLSIFSDDVGIRVGSPGSEPSLSDLCDFESSVGDMVKLETWEPAFDRHKFTMLLVDIFSKEGNIVAVLGEGKKRFEIPLNNIKSAFSLPHHPSSQSVQKAKKGSKK